VRNSDDIEVQLTLVDDGGRRVDTGPEDVGIGVVRLRRWQVHLLDKPESTFPGHAAYLVKVNYELTLESDLAPVRWFEIGFALVAQARGATIMDAVPRPGTRPSAAQTYLVSRQLDLVPTGDPASAHAHLPGDEDSVDLYGIGGSEVRWRHVSHQTDGVRPGSRTAWLVLLVPQAVPELRFQLAVRYDLDAEDDDLDYAPTQRPAEFSVALRERSVVIEPVPDIAPKRPAAGQPRVFICYAHQSDEHKESAHRLANLLLDNDIDVHMDRFDVGQRQDWQHWAIGQITRADFVIVLASAVCRDLGNGTFVSDRHPGMRSELAVIRNLLQANPRWQRYLLPVVLPREDLANIPLFLQPHTMDHYVVKEITTSGISDLLGAIKQTPARNWELR
jgi:hypothetical protein